MLQQVSKWSHEAFKTASAHGYQAPSIERQASGWEKKHEQDRQQQILKVTTWPNLVALTASYLVANPIAKAKKPFIIFKELILPAAKDICCELLGEDAVKK